MTYENVALSARMLQLAVGSGVGFRLEDRAVKNKYAELLQEYTAVEKLTAITQLVTILQVATLGSTHQFPFGFINQVWTGWKAKVAHQSQPVLHAVVHE